MIALRHSGAIHTNLTYPIQHNKGPCRAALLYQIPHIYTICLPKTAFKSAADPMQRSTAGRKSARRTPNEFVFLHNFNTLVHMRWMEL